MFNENVFQTNNIEILAIHGYQQIALLTSFNLDSTPLSQLHF